MKEIETKTRAEIFDIYTGKIYLEYPDVIDKMIWPPGEWSQEELDLIMRGYILKLNMDSTMAHAAKAADPEVAAKSMWRLAKLAERYQQLADEFVAYEVN